MYHWHMMARTMEPVSWSGLVAAGCVFGASLSGVGSAHATPTGVLVNTSSAGNQVRPAVASGKTGYFAVWDDGRAIRARQLDTAGRPVSTELTVSQLGQTPEVASRPRGGYVVVWRENGGIAGRRLGNAGRLRGDSFAISSTPISSTAAPAIAFNRFGQGLAVWAQQQAGAEALTNIVARRLGKDGLPRGEEIEVTSNQGLPVFRPRVAATRQGRFIVSWQTADGGTRSSDVLARRFANKGAFVGTEFIVNEVTNGDQHSPDVSAGVRKSFVVVWQSEDLLYGQRFGAAGARKGEEFVIEAGSRDAYAGQNLEQRPRVDSTKSGAFVVAWSAGDPIGLYSTYSRGYNGYGYSYGEYIATRRFDPTGTPLEARQDTGRGSPDAGRPGIAARGASFIVVWEDRGCPAYHAENCPNEHDTSSSDGSGYAIRGRVQSLD